MELGFKVCPRDHIQFLEWVEIHPSIYPFFHPSFYPPTTRFFSCLKPVPCKTSILPQSNISKSHSLLFKTESHVVQGGPILSMQTRWPWTSYPLSFPSPMLELQTYTSIPVWHGSRHWVQGSVHAKPASDSWADSWLAHIILWLWSLFYFFL